MEHQRINPLVKVEEGESYTPPVLSPEEKIYLVLIIFKEEVLRENTFELCFGRTEARNYCKQQIIAGADLNESKILLTSHTMKDAISLWWFMKKMETIYTDDPFDLDDFTVGDPDEAVTASKAEIAPQVDVMYDSQSTNKEVDL
jgi:hypothetical protein